MEYPRVGPRVQKDASQTLVYADLDDLIRLQYKATGFSFLPRQPVHSILAGRHASRLRGRGLNFEEIRRYRAGDDIRNMDWKVTARTRKPHVRVFTEERAARLAKHDFLVCTISDAAGADDESVRLITKITEHNDVLSGFIYDSLEAELPEAGRLVMAEEELQLEVDTSDRRLRRRFIENFEQRLEWIRRMSRLRSIPMLPIHTGEGVAEQVRRLLGHAPRGR